MRQRKAQFGEGVLAHDGIAVIPENKEDAVTILTEIKSEKNITADCRQLEFENLTTNDDHLMHITGKVKAKKETYTTK